MSSQKKAGVLLSYLSQGIQILSGLIYTPIMLRLLGQNEFGLYQLVYSVVSYLSLLSLGFNASYMRFYARLKVNNNEEEINRLNGMFMTIFIILAFVCLLCGVVLLINIKYVFARGLTSREYPIAKTLMILMVFNLALTFPNSVFDALTSAHEQFVFQKTINILQNIINPFIALPMLLLGYGSIGMVMASTVLIIIKLFINAYYCLKKLHIKFTFNGFKFQLLKEMWIFTFYIFLNQIIDQVNWSVDKFLLGRIVGTSSVAIYGLGAQINSMYIQFSTSVSSVFSPKINQIIATNNDNCELTLLFTRVGRIQFMILFFVLSGFLYFGKSFIGFWGGTGYGDTYYITVLLITIVTVPLIQSLGLEIQRAKNMHKVRSIVYLLIAIANIFISIPLINFYGAIGAAIGTALSLTVGNVIFMNWYYHYKVGLNMFYFWKEILKFARAMILPTIVGIFLSSSNYKNVWLFIIAIIIYSFSYGLSMWLLGMNLYEKQLIRKCIIYSKK